jgi:large conductance mechanosensitive channel
MKLLDEFRAFILRGNMIDLAVAVVIGVALNALISGLVSDLITPLIGVAGHFDFSTLQFTINGSVFMVGSFINLLINFLVILAVVFFVIVKPMSKFFPKPVPVNDTKECPQCLSKIPKKAKRCAFCTSRVS